MSLLLVERSNDEGRRFGGLSAVGGMLRDDPIVVRNGEDLGVSKFMLSGYCLVEVWVRRQKQVDGARRPISRYLGGVVPESRMFVVL